MPHSDDHVLILGAGRGKRMGIPKALMEIGGRAWWKTQADMLKRLGLEATWVVSVEVLDVMRASEECPNRLVLGEPNGPMFASLMAGMEQLRDDPPRGVFVLPVDVPVASKAVWEVLGGGERIAVPRVKGRKGHPVYLRWDWISQTLLDVALPDGRLDELIGPDAVIVDVADSAIALNLNTPEDVVSWTERGR